MIGQFLDVVQVSPAFLKFVLCHLAFMKDLHSHLFSLTRTKSKEDFRCYEKMQK